ncbi:MAG: hypothetical protein HXX17_16580 [Geobacteraceae bacterium]|nr:hypothetical protein [Geobacteraceae bacterium]
MSQRGRKPIDKQQPIETRQAIWDEIRQLKSFFQPEIERAVNLESSNIRDYLTGLLRAGYLDAKTTKDGIIKRISYTLIKDAGRTAPRVRKDGSEVTQGRCRQYMWNVIPILKMFTCADLAYNASTPEHTVALNTARDYIGALHNAGYLAPAKPCKSGEKQLWKLKHGKWTGPHPPQIQRTKQVYDPNLRAVVWQTITGGAE